MRSSTLVAVASSLVLVSSVAYAQPEPYPSAPAYLSELVTQAAQRVVQLHAEDAASADARRSFRDGIQSYWDKMVFVAIADGVLGGGTEIAALDRLEGLVNQENRWLIDTARTDKQIGSTAASAGTIDLFDRPSIPKLLGLAIERGAVVQEDSGSSVTLRTSPYLLSGFGLTGEDTAETYEKWGWLEKLGLAATFNLDGSDGRTTGDFEFENLAAFQVKVNPRSRSPRGSDFTREWETRMKPAIDRRLEASTGAMSDLINGDAAAREAGKEAYDKLERQFPFSALAEVRGETGQPQDAATDTAARLANDAAAEEIETFLLGFLRAELFDPFANRTATLQPQTEVLLANRLVPGLNMANVEFGIANKEFREFSADWNKRFSWSLAWTLHRVDDNGSNFSEIKFLGQHKWAWIDMNLNAGVTLYHDSDSRLDQDTVRDFNISLAAEGQLDNLIFGRFDRRSMAPITFALAARYQRLEENGGDIGVFQATTNVPIAAGFSIPLALTYATRSENDGDSEFRVNIGLELDTDVLRALWGLSELR